MLIHIGGIAKVVAPAVAREVVKAGGLKKVQAMTLEELKAWLEDRPRLLEEIKAWGEDRPRMVEAIFGVDAAAWMLSGRSSWWQLWHCRLPAVLNRT